MKKKRSNNKDKMSVSIVSNEYYGKNTKFWAVFAARVVLSCLVSVSGMLYITWIYGFDTDTAALAFLTAAATAVLSLIFSGLSKKISIPVILVIVLTAGFFFRKEITDDFKAFWDVLMIHLESRLLNTKTLIFRPMRNEFSDDTINSCRNILNIISFFYSMLTAAFTCTVRKIRISVIAFITVILSAAAFAAERAEFHPSLIVFISAVIGIGCIGSIYTVSSQYHSASKSDRGKRLKPFNFFKRLNESVRSYGKYIGSGVCALLIAASSMSLSAYYVVSSGKFDREEMYKSVENFLSNAFISAGDLFNVSFGEIPDNGYFADGSDISNKITISAPTHSDLPVLDVLLEDNENPLYLRGDIGYVFDGSGWESIGNINYDKIGCYDSLEEAYEQFCKDMGDIYAYVYNHFKIEGDLPSNFDPELYDPFLKKFYESYYLKIKDVILQNADFDAAGDMYVSARRNIAAAGFDPDDFFGLQKVKINYKRNSNTIIAPLIPYGSNYRISNIFDCFGDFVLRMKKGQNYIKSYETVTLYPKHTPARFAVYFLSKPLYDNNGWNMYDITNLTDYEKYIHVTYMDIPESEKKNISGFLDNVCDYIMPDRSTYSVDNIDSVYGGYMLANSICEYFSRNYNYSLETDNTSGNNTILGNFLYETYSGHCALYATVMTLAMREAGFPARYVTGYIVQGPGTLTEDGYEYTLREKNLHAWTEVYFKDVGWLPFDPTSSGSEDYLNEINGITPPQSEQNPAEESETTVSSASLSKESETEESDVNIAHTGGSNGVEVEDPFVFKIPEWLTVLLIIAAFLIMLALLIMWQVKNTDKCERKIKKSFMEEDTTEAVKRISRFIYTKLLKNAGYTQNNGETQQSFAERIDTEFLGGGTVMYQASLIIQKEEFGGKEAYISEEERELVYRCFITLLEKYLSSKKRIPRFIARMQLFLS